MKGYFEEIGDKSIGIIRHRIDYLENVGEYNVGIVYFKGDEYGKKCLSWWKDMMMNHDNPYSKTHGMCGDQKYLELFEPLFGEEAVCIVDKNVGHLAPWNVTFHDYKNNKIIWNNKKQDLYFFHFAHFVPNFEKNTYKTSYNNEWVWGEPAKTHKFIENLYEEYFAKSRVTGDKYSLQDTIC